MAYIRNHKYHFIYKTTCLETNRFYIGMHSTSNLDDGYLGSGRRIWLSITKYGKSKHSLEILEFLPNRTELKNREKEIVNESLLKDPMCMNLQLGGGGGFLNKEHQLKCSSAGGKTTNLEKSANASKKLTETNLRRVSEGSHKAWKQNYDWRGKTHTEETRLKIGKTNSTKQKGEGNSQFGTKWVSHPVLGTCKIPATQLAQFLANGYLPGRKSAALSKLIA